MSQTDRPRALVALLALTAHCSAVVTPSTATDASVADASVADAPAADVARPAADVPPEPPLPACDAVRASCGGPPALFVRARAARLTGLDGARARVVVRYLRQADEGIQQPRGVVVGGDTVRNGSFEACICVPMNAGGYPEVAAVVFAPGSAGSRPEDVVRAHYSQRFAVLEDLELTEDLAAPASRSATARALASFVARDVSLAIPDLDARFDGRMLSGVYLSAATPVPTERAFNTVMRGAVGLRWFLPGPASTEERAVLVADLDRDGRCGPGDETATVPLGGRSMVPAAAIQWSGAAGAVQSACALVETGATP